MSNRKALAALIPAVLTATFTSAWAETPKELKTRPGVSIAMVNLVNPRADCSVNPGPVVLPSLKQKPENGTIQMQILVTDVPASASCPARKIPTITLIYTPQRNFTGIDNVQIEIETENRSTSLSYRITVGAQSEPL